MGSTWTLVAAAVGATYVFLRTLLRLTQDAREPPALANSVPFLGPVLEMMRRGVNFHRHMSETYKLPIYTLRLPGQRLYIVNSTSLIPHVQRNPHALSFGPVVAGTTKTFGCSQKSIDIVGADAIGERGYIQNFSRAMHGALGLGRDLDGMSKAAVAAIAVAFDGLAAEGGQEVGLFRLLRKQMSLATSYGVYGSRNPLADPSLMDDWQTYEKHVMLFFLGLPPSIFARRALRARERLARAFYEYFDAGHHREASALVRARYDLSIKFGLPLEDIGRVELGGAFAVLGSTIPATFWLLFHVYSDPTTLGECRREVARIVREQDGACRLDITSISTRCPILMSTFQEMLRTYGSNFGVRKVLQDHMLDGRYLLRRGALVMIPSLVHQSAPDTWGPTHDTFDHKRFLRSADGGKRRPNPVAFRGFGGGSTLCPGRHFATTEILAFAALMILRFDVQPVGGVWSRPGFLRSSTAAGVVEPDSDVKVRITPMDDREWVIESGENKGTNITVEDGAAEG